MVHTKSTSFPLLRSRCAFPLVHSPIQKCDDLAAGAGFVGRKAVIAGAEGDILLYSPQHRIPVIAVRRYIQEGILGIALGIFHEPVQEGHDLGPGAGGIGAEGGGGSTLCDAVSHGPGHGIGIIGIRAHIGEFTGLEALRGHTGGPVQEGHSLGSGAGLLGGETDGGRTRGDAHVYRPENAVIKIFDGPDIQEGADIFAIGILLPYSIEGQIAVRVDLTVGIVGRNGGMGVFRPAQEGKAGALRDLDMEGTSVPGIGKGVRGGFFTAVGMVGDGVVPGFHGGIVGCGAIAAGDIPVGADIAQNDILLSQLGTQIALIQPNPLAAVPGGGIGAEEIIPFVIRQKNRVGNGFAVQDDAFGMFIQEGLQRFHADAADRLMTHADGNAVNGIVPVPEESLRDPGIGPDRVFRDLRPTVAAAQIQTAADHHGRGGQGTAAGGFLLQKQFIGQGRGAFSGDGHQGNDHQQTQKCRNDSFDQ